MDVPKYEGLIKIYGEALKRLTDGKGLDRHARDLLSGVVLPFDQQPSAQIARLVGLGYPLGQAMKKAQEAMGLLARGDELRAMAEIQDALNFCAIAAFTLRGAQADRLAEALTCGRWAEDSDQ